jgi:hypothetical protein
MNYFEAFVILSIYAPLLTFISSGFIREIKIIIKNDVHILVKSFYLIVVFISILTTTITYILAIFYLLKSIGV